MQWGQPLKQPLAAARLQKKAPAGEERRALLTGEGAWELPEPCRRNRIQADTENLASSLRILPFLSS
jgi:hypothetical protein